MDLYVCSSMGVRSQAEVVKKDSKNAYGPDGEWDRLFRNDSSYSETRLLRDPLSAGDLPQLSIFGVPGKLMLKKIPGGARCRIPDD